MWPESAERSQALRSGLTTGTCATACCVAAAQALFSEQKADNVNVTLPRGKVVALTISDYQPIACGMKAATVKDAGDDPDVTHGATLFVELKLSQPNGVRFRAATGVGVVTRQGLALAIGEPAINPVPRKMMIEHLQRLADKYQYEGGFDVAVGVEDGELLAQKTMNPRLGIKGGISILGTTGIVRPFSCVAYIASIHQGIDVAMANDLSHIAATTGSTSEASIRERYQLPDMALIEMGDFVGALLKYLKKAPVKKVSLCGGFGKISKLANGYLDLNSRKSAIDFQQLAGIAKQSGATDKLCEKIATSNTSIEALRYCQLENVDLAAAICAAALQKASAIVPDDIKLEVWAVDRQGQFVGNAGVSV